MGCFSGFGELSAGIVGIYALKNKTKDYLETSRIIDEQLKANKSLAEIKQIKDFDKIDPRQVYEMAMQQRGNTRVLKELTRDNKFGAVANFK